MYQKTGYGDVNCIIRLTVRSSDVAALIIVVSFVLREKVTGLKKDMLLILWTFHNRRWVYEVLLNKSVAVFKAGHFKFFCSNCSCINLLLVNHWYETTRYSGTPGSICIFGIVLVLDVDGETNYGNSMPHMASPSWNQALPTSDSRKSIFSTGLLWCSWPGWVCDGN